ASRLDALKRIKALKDSERELEDMIASFRKQREDAQKLAQEQKPGSSELKALEPAPSLAAKPALKAAPVKESVSAVQKVEPVPTLVALRGKLPPPVEGRMTGNFGRSYNPKTNLLTFQKGITFLAATGAPVRAVSAGKVVFAG